MGEKTGIAWCDHTFNPFVGCAKVSPACDHCYAESWAKRYGQAELWQGERRRTSKSAWAQPIRWNRLAREAGVRRRVFCASLADVFDNQVDPAWRADLWALIGACPDLDFLLLTKRPQNIAKMLPVGWGAGWPNVWLGTTTENAEEANRRIPHLLAVPAVVRFLSAEPLLGPVDIGGPVRAATLAGKINGGDPITPIGWVIVGGESGPNARQMHRLWADMLIAQCRAAGVAVFFKQVGSARRDSWPAGITGKGDDPAEWPPELRVLQAFPRAA